MMMPASSHRWETALSWRWALWDLRILHFRNPKGRRLLRVPSLAHRTGFMGVLKAPGTSFRACVHRAFWQYHYLRAFSRVDTMAPGILAAGFLWHPYHLQLFSCLTATLVVMGLLAKVPPRDVCSGRGS